MAEKVGSRFGRDLDAPGPATFSPAVAPSAAIATAMPQSATGSPRLDLAAAAGNPAAMFELGARYAEGRGVARDLAVSAEWYARAAEAGVAAAAADGADSVSAR